jgi:hypothetical protein
VVKVLRILKITRILKAFKVVEWVLPTPQIMMNLKLYWLLSPVWLVLILRSLIRSRALEDIAVVYLGSAVFKIARLTFVALSCVHIFACIFFRVKVEGANSPGEVIDFYASRGVDENVRAKHCFLSVFN